MAGKRQHILKSTIVLKQANLFWLSSKLIACFKSYRTESLVQIKPCNGKIRAKQTFADASGLRTQSVVPATGRPEQVCQEPPGSTGLTQS